MSHQETLFINNGWSVQVYFGDEYKKNFSKEEAKDLIYSEYRFALAIQNIINTTEIVPVIGDWIDPLNKQDYTLDIGRVSDRTFYTANRVIQFEIE